jgi:hypothetical protein
MKQLIIIFFFFLSLISNVINAQFIGINYTPGRKGAGICIGTEKIIFGFEKGRYISNIDNNFEHIDLMKITAHFNVYKYTFDKGYTITYAGFGYNEFKGETNFLLNKGSLYKISFEIGGIVNVGTINPMIFFDFVNWEGKFGLIIKL